MKKLICSLLVVVMALTGISFSGKAETASAYEAADTYEAVVVNSVKPAEKADISAYLPPAIPQNLPSSSFQRKACPQKSVRLISNRSQVNV